jgi:hypothetical protein
MPGVKTGDRDYDGNIQRVRTVFRKENVNKVNTKKVTSSINAHDLNLVNVLKECIITPIS